MRHRTFRLLVLGALLLGSATAGGAQTTMAAATGAPATGAPAKPAPATPAAPAAKPAAAAPAPAAPAFKLSKNQTLRMVIREPTSMDPNLAGDHSIWYVDQVFEGLYKVLDDGKTIWLGAKSLDVSKDGLTWTFKLNPAAKWTDGTPVTAQDYEFSWKRAIDPKLASDTATFFSAIKGAEDYNTGKLKDVAEVAVKAVDATTLQVKMAKPAPYFRSVAGLTYLYPVPRQVVEKHGDKWTEAANIVTNGVFKMESWKHDQEMVLVRNDAYWGKKPTLQKVVMRIAPAGELCTADFRAFEANETDFAMCVPTPDIERVQKDPALGKQLTAELLSASQFLVFDTTHAPWDKTKVRQALNLAIDRDKVSQVLSRGLYKPTRVLVAPGIQGHKPANALKGGAAEAKKLLAEAGFPNGQGFPEFKLTAPDIRGNRILAEVLQQMWKDTLGISTQVEIMEPKAFSAWRSGRKSASFDVYSRGGWWSDYEDPTNWYNTLVEEDWLNTHWKHEQFSKLTRTGASELDPAKRKQMYEEADAILERESPTVGLWYFTDYWMRKPWLRGLQHTRILGFFWIRDAAIAEH
jgi:oligopeptide transport system substrate-binding protein